MAIPTSYHRMTAIVYEPGHDYSFDWMHYLDKGLDAWSKIRQRDSHHKYGFATSDKWVSYQQAIEEIGKTHPHYVLAMQLADLVGTLGSQGLKAWVDNGSARFILAILAALESIPGSDVAELHKTLETVMPYIDLDTDTLGEWVTSLQEKTYQNCNEVQVGWSENSPVYEEQCEDVVIDVETCLIWDRLPEMDARFKSLRTLIQEIGAYFIMRYEGWE